MMEQQAPKNPRSLSRSFGRFARGCASYVGRPTVFLFAVLVVTVWGITGPYFHYSDTWQLVINTGTSVITFLMVFLIQNTQDRDAKEIHLKLNELIRAKQGANNDLLALEDLDESQLKQLRAAYLALGLKTGPDVKLPDEAVPPTPVTAD